MLTLSVANGEGVTPALTKTAGAPSIAFF